MQDRESGGTAGCNLAQKQYVWAGKRQYSRGALPRLIPIAAPKVKSYEDQHSRSELNPCNDYREDSIGGDELEMGCADAHRSAMLNI